MKIGSINIENPIALAPMEDITDVPFRQICKRMGADLVYTEFTSSEALIRNINKALKKISFTDEERPLAVQIFGGNEISVEEAVRVAEKIHPDFIDINAGCWNKNHAMRGEGAGLLRDLSRFERIVRAAVRATHLPVTVKTRLGWDEKTIVIMDVARMVEASGAQALTVHCRTRCQGYKGKADWSWLPKIKKAVTIPIIGNGDLLTAQDVKQMFDLGCDGVMIGRAAIGNPWIFKQAKHFIKTGEIPFAPSLLERIDLCIEHLEASVAYRGVRDGVFTFRKHYKGYLHGFPGLGKLRSEIIQLKDQEQIIRRLREFQLEISETVFSPH